MFQENKFKKINFKYSVLILKSITCKFIVKVRKEGYYHEI